MSHSPLLELWLGGFSYLYNIHNIYSISKICALLLIKMANPVLHNEISMRNEGVDENTLL